MEKKYINSSKYKKVSSDSRRKRSENISRKIKEEKEVKNTAIKTAANSVKKDTRTVSKVKTRKKRSSKLTIILLVVSILLILCALRLAFKDENESFFDIFGVKVDSGVIEKLDIAVVDSIDVLDINSKNVIFTELNNYTNGVLLKVTDNYDIEYDLLDSIVKNSNTEYILNISMNNFLTASVLKSRLTQYMDDSSKYYGNCKNIESIEELNSKSVKITLKEGDACFMYNLQLPINFSTTNTGIYSANTTRGTSNKITYIKKEYVTEDVPKSISLTTAQSDDEVVEMFKNSAIDIFFTDSYDISEKLGKTDADIRSYLNGKCVFLFGNKYSEAFSKKEIRQAIAYSIDREKIRKDIYLNSGSVLDIPEVYSESKYKYDIYAAQNILLASGYTLQNSVLVKSGNKLELTLLVNKTDETKVKIATYIKEDLESIGITINLKLLGTSELEKEVKYKNYDLVLADVSLNENPSISFMQEYLSVSDLLTEKLQDIKDAENVQDTVQNVKSLIQIMSDEVVCIGIHADTTYMVSKKGLDNFSNIKYMKIFADVLLTKNN